MRRMSNLLPTEFILLSSFINETWTCVTVANYMCGRKRVSALQQTIYFFIQWMKNLRQYMYVYFILIQLNTVNCIRHSLFHKANCRSSSQETPRVSWYARDLSLLQKFISALGPTRPPHWLLEITSPEIKRKAGAIDHSHHLIFSMKQSLSGQSNWFSDSQEIPHIL